MDYLYSDVFVDAPLRMLPPPHAAKRGPQSPETYGEAHTDVIEPDDFVRGNNLAPRKRHLSLSLSDAMRFGTASWAESSDRLYLISRPGPKRLTRALEVDRKILREHFAASPLGVAAGATRRAACGAASMAPKLGALVTTRHLWSTRLSPSALSMLKEMLYGREVLQMPTHNARELLLFCEAHLLTGLPTRMARLLVSTLNVDNVASRFTLALTHLHTDSERAYASLAAGCTQFVILHYEQVLAQQNFLALPEETRQVLMRHVPKFLHGLLLQHKDIHIAPFVPAIMASLRDWDGRTPCPLPLHVLLCSATEQHADDVLEMLQNKLSAITYTRMVAADEARILRLAARDDSAERIARVLVNISAAHIRNMLKRESFYLVTRLAQQGLTGALDALFNYLSAEDLRMLCYEPTLLPSALGSQNNLDLFYWLETLVGHRALGELICDRRCSALQEAASNDTSVHFCDRSVLRTYIDCSAALDANVTRNISATRRTFTRMLDCGHSENVMLAFAPLRHTERSTILLSHSAQLLQRILAGTDKTFAGAAWAWAWHEMPKHEAHATQRALASTLCAAAAEGGHHAICLMLFVYIPRDLASLTSQHPFAIALNFGHTELADAMLLRLDEDEIRAWATDVEARAVRLALAADAPSTARSINHMVPGSFEALMRMPSYRRIILRACLEASPEYGLEPLLEQRTDISYEAMLADDDFALIADAMHASALECLALLLRVLPEPQRERALRMRLPEVLADAIRRGNWACALNLAHFSPRLFCETLSHNAWTLARTVLRHDIHRALDLLCALPVPALDALWHAHGQLIVRAALNNSHVRTFVFEHFDLNKQRPHLLADRGALIREALDADHGEADVLAYLQQLEPEELSMLATDNNFALLRHAPNVVFDAQVFGILCATLTPEAVLELVRGPPSRGLNLHLAAYPTAFEVQMNTMRKSERHRVEHHIDCVLMALSEATG